MKNRNYTIPLGSLVLVLFLSLVLGSCKKNVENPVATYIYSPGNGGNGTSFVFTARVEDEGCKDCQVYEYLWNYGDQNSEWVRTKNNTTTHTFYKSGKFKVTLRVRNSMGYLSEDYTREITVSGNGGGGGGGGNNGNSPTVPVPVVPRNHDANVSTRPTLQWNCSDPDGDELTYEVYISEFTPPEVKIRGIKTNTFAPGVLSESTYYYWRIVADDGNGNVIYSPIWTFSTEGDGELPNRPPNVPTNPYPQYGAENVTIGKYLHWSASDFDGDDLRFDIYFGATNPPPLVQQNTTNQYYDPGLNLEIGTEYYWKVVAKDNEDETSSPVWVYRTSVDAFHCPSEYTDDRDGTTYKIVQIGNQCWMAENLKYGVFVQSNVPTDNQINNNVVEFYAMNNNESNVDTYGGLYQWSEAMNYTDVAETRGICPSGFHLPSESEWNQLVIHLGGNNVAGEHLKQDGTTGFDALFGGQRVQQGSFQSYGQSAYFWSSTQKDYKDAFEVNLSNLYQGVYYSFNSKLVGKSVRCIKD